METKQKTTGKAAGTVKTEMEKLKVQEVIVVEGRDDTNAVLRAIDGMTIETHGFGIRKETWKLLEKAYEEKGLILFTDPDHSGEEIRRKLTERFPESRQAFLTRDEAEAKGDIGIENASPRSIAEAISKARYTARKEKDIFTEEDLYESGLLGQRDSKEMRQALGAALGIGYGNGRTLLKKLNMFDIRREDFEQKMSEIRKGKKNETIRTIDSE